MRYDIHQRELALTQELTDIALTNREQFRSQAKEALRRLDRHSRKNLSRIQTKNVVAYDVLASWNDQLRPLRKQLEAKRSDRIFRTSIKKQLYLHESETDVKIKEILDRRLYEVDEAFYNEFYPASSDQRSNAKKLLQQTEPELNRLLAHLTEYILYKDIASENNIVIIDPHAFIVKRMMSRLRIRRERNRTSRIRQERLAYINRREKELARINGGLLAAIQNMEWDLVTIISMRNQYDKRVNTLPQKDNANALKRLAIFEKLTQQFRDDYVEKTTTAKTSLEQTRKLTEEVDALLLRIFDLSTVQKNQLLTQSKEYRELLSERQALLAEQ